MVVEFLLTSLFLLTNYNIGNNQGFSLEKQARLNFANFNKFNDKANYNEKFIDMLYKNEYFDERTSLTVLTHGMYGDKNYWFPKIFNGDSVSTDFYSHESLAYKIVSNEQYSLDNIPILTFSPYLSDLSSHDVNIQQLAFDSITETYNFTTLNFSNINHIRQLFSKHVVLIYDSPSIIEATGDETNEEVSAFFCRALDSVLSKVSVFYQGKLPRINLIGHSRGGLLNLYYAEKRSQIIDNFISIGTPFEGSIWANALNSLCKIGRFFGSNNELFQFNFDGVLDNGFYGNGYRLNQLTDSYKVAIGFEMSASELCNEILNEAGITSALNLSSSTFGNNNIVWKILNKIYQELIDNNEYALDKVLNFANLVDDLCSSSLGLIDVIDYSDDLLSFFPSYSSLFNDIEFVELHDLTIEFLNNVRALCSDIFNYNHLNNCIRSDFCVDLNSQIGSAYNSGIFDQKIVFSAGVQGGGVQLIDKYLSNPGLPKVIHNYECNMPLVTQTITNILSSNNSIQCIPVADYNSTITINPYRVPAYCLSYEDQELYYSESYSFFGNEFEFRDYYYYENEIINNNALLEKFIDIDDVRITTHRMRTGYIQNERIVMSPNRSNAGLAFIEFYFSEPIYTLSFDYSLWSSSELFQSSHQEMVYSVNTELRDFIFGTSDIYYDFYPQYTTMTSRGQFALMNLFTFFESLFDFERYNISTFSTNRSSPKTEVISREEGFTFLGLYTACTVNSANKNKGRICLSNFKIYD